MKPNVFQRMAAAGARVLTRMATGAAAKVRSVFKGAEMSRLWWDWVASPIAADQELMNDFLRLRARAREMRRNHPLIRKYLKILANNVVGPDGFKLRGRVKNNDGTLNVAFNKKIQAAWFKWSKEVTADGQHTLTSFQHFLIKALATEGEILIRKIRNFKGNAFRFALQAIDPDLLDHMFMRAPLDGQNEIRLGIEIDVFGRPVAYWLWDRHPSDLINISAKKRIRVPADELIHFYLPDRSSQSRGITWLNSVMMPAKMLDGYVEAEVVAARIGSSKMGFFQMKTAEDSEPPVSDGTNKRAKLEMSASPGSFEELPPGYEFKEWNPEHPSTAFPPFIKAMQRWIAAGLGVGYNGLSGDLEAVNYSSIRADMLIERDEWRTLQALWIPKILDNIYAEWLTWAQLSMQLILDNRPNDAFLEVVHIPRGWQWVDPLKDVNASIAEIDNGLNSRARVCAEQGTDFEEIANELLEEQDIIDSLGLILTGLGVPGGAQAGDTTKTAEEIDEQNEAGGQPAGDGKKSAQVVFMETVRKVRDARAARNAERFKQVSQLYAREG